MESRLQEAIDYKNENLEVAVAAVAREFGVPRRTLVDRLNGGGPRRGRAATHSRLTELQERGLCRYIDRLNRINLSVRREFVKLAVNNILRKTAGTSKFTPVSPVWTSRFLRRYKYNVIRQKTLDISRQVVENIDYVRKYFETL
jgi:hypothetical protein